MTFLNQRNLSIDLVKILAMYMVLMLHLHVHRRLCSALDYSSTPFFYSITGIAIPLFFMVSGYLLSAKKDIDYKYSLRKIFGIVRFAFLVCVTWDIFVYFTSHQVKIDFPVCLIKDGRFGHFWYFGSMILLYLALPVLTKVYANYSRAMMIAFGSVCVCFFALDWYKQFEKEYIIQTFRLWYWIFYFGVGASIRRYESYFLWVKPYCVLIFMTLYLVSVYFIKIGGIEYHFGNPFCMLYATSVFVVILRVQITTKRLIQRLSLCFLPIYAYHEIALGFLVYHQPFLTIEQTVVFPFWIEYVIASFVITGIALVVIKIPGMKSFFSI